MNERIVAAIQRAQAAQRASRAAERTEEAAGRAADAASAARRLASYQANEAWITLQVLLAEDEPPAMVTDAQEVRR